MGFFVVRISGYVYKHIFKRILFLINPEFVHLKATKLGSHLGNVALAKKIISFMFKVESPLLEQRLFEITFNNPIGLAAGFDYEAQLTQILPSLGFGFGTVGTLTHLPYGGNPRPLLGRLPKSRSLMVNKGFKNLGIAQTLSNLQDKTFEYPVGISIGKTNTASHKTQEEAIKDVTNAFKTAEAARTPFSYYELNISCPNVMGTIEFYEPHHLKSLLDALAVLHITRPVFIKMPISKNDAEIRAMMAVIVQHSFIKAVILGNLQRDRHHPMLVKQEVQKFSQGNFSGLPCQEQSDRLIALVHKEFGKHIKIIGCGGVFSADDAYRKIKLGASLVQLITGIVFEGPQLVSEINRDLIRLLKSDGYSSVREAVGAAFMLK